ASALRIKSASIYYHYPDKEQILYELVHGTLRRSHDGVAAALAGERSPARRLAAVVVHHVALNALRPMEATLVETELRSLRGDRRRRVLEERDSHEAILHEVLEDGRRAGSFDVVDSKLCTYAVISMCANVGAWFRSEGRLPLQEVAAVYAQ